jgi:hypothetical protein
MNIFQKEGHEGASSPQSNCDWHKSSRSYTEGNCVEVAYTCGHVLVRDSKAVIDGGPHLQFSTTSWESFINSIKVGKTAL